MRFFVAVVGAGLCARPQSQQNRREGTEPLPYTHANGVRLCPHGIRN